MSNQVNSKRIYYIEVLRVLATFAVVFIHVAGKNWYGEIGSYNWNVFTAYSGLVKFCVPIFFMISGALFLRKDKKLNMKRLFFHNILHLVVFLIFWSACYHVLNVIRSGQTLTFAELLNFSKNIIKGNTEIFFWFVYAMIGLYIILPIVKAFVNGAEKSQLLYFVILCFLFNSVYVLISKIPALNPIFMNMAKLEIHITGGYLGYFVLGYYLAQYPPKAAARRLLYVLGTLGIIISTLVTWKVCVTGGEYSEAYFNYLFPGVVLWSVAVFLFGQVHGDKLLKLKGFIGLASKCSLGIYGIHMIFVTLLWDYGITTFSFSPILSVPVISLAVFAVSLLVVALLAKIPIVKNWIV